MRKNLEYITQEHKIVNRRSVETVKHNSLRNVREINKDIARQIDVLNAELDDLRVQFNQRIAHKASNKVKEKISD